MPTAKLKENAYYRLSNQQILQVRLDTGAPTTLGGTTYGGKVYCETLLKERMEVRRKVFETATQINYHPTIPEIWRLTQKIQPNKEEKTPKDPKHERMFLWMKRLEFFFNKLIEFNYLRIKTLGYYPNYNKIALKETVGQSIAYKLSEALYHGFDNPQNDRTKECGKLLRKWATTGNEEARSALFKKAAFREPLLAIMVDRECPTTGARFTWLCNGKTIWPYKRHLCQKESKVKVDLLRQKYEALKAKPKKSPKETAQLEELTEIFEKEFGWMRAYHLTDLERVKPFSKAYADPQTGEFPKAIVEINVPTGELVFANSLFKYLKDFPKDEEHSPENSVSHTLGRNNNVFFHAKENDAFYVPLSNNSPHVWQNRKNPNKLRIGRTSDEPQKGEWGYAQAIKGWIDRGYICTDLWAFHAVDRSRLPTKIEVDHFIVKVTPGRYQLINHYEHPESRNGIFCEIQRIGDCTQPPNPTP